MLVSNRLESEWYVETRQNRNGTDSDINAGALHLVSASLFRLVFSLVSITLPLQLSLPLLL